MNTVPRPPLDRLFGWQIAAAALLGGVFYPLGGWEFVAGCAIQIAGAAYFARLAFRHRGAARVRAQVRAIYRGEAGKLAITAALFAVAFGFARCDPVWLLAGYAAMQLVHLFLGARYLAAGAT
ncbi:MAG: hypothetical protein KatS3mg124_2114 [Porticoccaceae bacterium]|nr:MAG: hypothetical protein KatS3mg124_2114 [Porticoccaceae bacterium]